jgi:hypothetical protein
MQHSLSSFIRTKLPPIMVIGADWLQDGKNNVGSSNKNKTGRKKRRQKLQKILHI